MSHTIEGVLFSSRSCADICHRMAGKEIFISLLSLLFLKQSVDAFDAGELTFFWFYLL